LTLNILGCKREKKVKKMVAIYLLDKRYEDAIYLQDKKNNILKFKNDNDEFNYLHCRIKFNDEKHIEDFGLFLDRGIK